MFEPLPWRTSSQRLRRELLQAEALHYLNRRQQDWIQQRYATLAKRELLLGLTGMDIKLKRAQQDCRTAEQHLKQCEQAYLQALLRPDNTSIDR